MDVLLANLGVIVSIFLAWDVGLVIHRGFQGVYRFLILGFPKLTVGELEDKEGLHSFIINCNLPCQKKFAFNWTICERGFFKQNVIKRHL